MMPNRLTTGIALAVMLILGIGLYWWRCDAPRRESLASLSRLHTALEANDRTELLALLVILAAIQDRTAAEQTEFLVKVLHDELSPAGLAVLRRAGDFGPLNRLFPAEAEAWAQQAGVNPVGCVALRLERHGFRAEVVLLKPANLDSQSSTGDAPHRIVRVNNVKQMADLKTSTAERNP